MKKIQVITAGLLLSMGLAGCSSTSSENMKKVSVAQIMEHSSLNTIRDSFLEEMKTLGYEDGVNIEIDVKNASGDSSTLNSIMQTFAGNKTNVIVAIATPTAQIAANYSSEIPVVFSAVSDPVSANLMKDPTKPDKNITGTSDEIQVDQILRLAQTLQPNIKKIGVLYSSAEANSVSNLEKAKAYAKQNQLEIIEAPIADISDMQTAAQSLASKVDAIFTPNDNNVASSMPILVQAAKEAGIAVYTGADSMVKDGGFATVGIDYESLGKETAKMVDQILKGKAVSELPVVTFKTDLNIYINEKVQKELQITLPDEVQKNPNLKMIGA